MDHESYEKLTYAHLGDVNPQILQKLYATQTDPYIKHFISLALDINSVYVDWDTKPFTIDFRSTSSQERLEETIFAFLLRIAAIVKEEMYIRVFRKPETLTAFLTWKHTLKYSIFSVLTLIYNLEWTVQDYIQLDITIMNMLHHGKGSALRELMEHFNIKLAKPLYEVEKIFYKLNFLSIDQFSGFFWRMLHWMAEAMNIRKNRPYARQLWHDLLMKGPLYRTLRCNICMHHYQEMVKYVKPLNEIEDYAKLWFDMHNQVHTFRRQQYSRAEPDYTNDEYKLDSEFMRQQIK